jgi:hypothetical protein
VKNILLYDVDFVDIRGVKRIRSYYANNKDSAESKALGRKDVAKIIGIHKADNSRIPYGGARVRTFEQFEIQVSHGTYLSFPDGAKKIMRHPRDYGEYNKPKKNDKEFGDYER